MASATKLTIAVLGGAEVRSGTAHAVTLPTRKAKALLVYLAMAAGEPQTRGKLATLFWDRSAEEQARASLRQTLSVLRKALATAGADILKVEGESIGLEPGGVEVDALEFARLIGSGSSVDLEQATALYRGDFLAGFGHAFFTFAQPDDQMRSHLSQAENSHWRSRQLQYAGIFFVEGPSDHKIV